MIIFIEGNEGTGKTTLINQLMEELPMTALKSTKTFKGLSTLYYDLAKSPQIFVSDRGFITDIVYRIRDKEKGNITLGKIGLLCDNCSNDMKIVFCHNKKSFENSTLRGEKIITDRTSHETIEENFKTVKTIIKSFTDIETFDYDYDYQNVYDVIKFIKRKGE